jgi:hypothetical protein
LSDSDPNRIEASHPDWTTMVNARRNKGVEFDDNGIVDYGCPADEPPNDRETIAE